jgi:DNA-binding NtrC family response regulator/tetratricopeptide (TPR) repeat protein
VRGLDDFFGQSPPIRAIREQIARILGRHSGGRGLPPVLIRGETGTGKGLVARVMHEAGPRAGGPFVDVNCAAIPVTLLEAELFGYERGAFTDARQAKAGLFQVAHRGTLFLDEIGHLPEALQAKLLKAIEDRAIRRLGGTRSEPVDVWILSATADDLTAASRERPFREDLYHRLAVLTLVLPPLRERRGDILLLAEVFLDRACAEYGLAPRRLAPDAVRALLAYPWPGNVRQLMNTMERVALLSESALVTAEMLALPDDGAEERPAEGDEPDAVAGLVERMGRVEREHLLDALRRTNWNITRAAERLGISRDKLRYRITRYRLRSEALACPAARAPLGPGLPVPAEPRPLTPTVNAAMRWESQRLTLLYAALGLPSEAAAGVSRGRVLEVVIEKVQSFGGSVEELGPTGLIAAFGLEPVEDAPRRAAHAALAIQNAVERGPHELGSRPIKLGIHVSQFLVGRGGSAPQVDLDAKRVAWVALEALVAGAEAGTIVVSEAALPFLERRFDLAPIAPADGVSPPAYRLVGHERSGFRVGRRMAGFVGRRHEIAILRDHLASAMRGHGQVIGIVGGAGIGKSRLLHEFRRTLSGSQVRYLSGRCLPYWTGIPYSTVREILRQFCGVSEADTPELIVAKVRRALVAVGMDPAERLPYLLALLGVERDEDRLALVSPEGVRSRTFETLRQMCLQGSRRRPIVFVGEDVHWIDRTSEECVASLVDNLAGAPILLVVTHRPGYRAPWSDKSYATQLALQPLSAEDSLSVVRSILGRPLPEALARPIVEKAEGNPFFLEELARAVGEQGDAQGLTTVPGTIEEVLLARLGRLSEPARRLVECASVLGREFRLSLLRAVWDRAEPLDVALQELVRVEFLYEQHGEPGGIHAFTHGLTQEVAYESLPVTRQFQGWFLAFLADAYCLAGRYGDAREAGMRALGLTRAGGFLYGVGCAQRALGRIARQRGAMADAETALREAARTFESVRARHEVARTHLDLAAVLHVQGRTEAAIPLLETAHRLFETLPAPRQTERARAVARDLGVAIGA